MSQRASQSFWQKPKCVLCMDSSPPMLTITLIRKEEGEHIQYKRKFTILQSYGHSPCSCTASTAKLFYALIQSNTKENTRVNVIEEQLQRKEFSCYAHGFGNWLPFVDSDDPIPAELASLRHPLSSADGSKKWRLHLDMRGFAPENVNISIVDKNSAPILKVEMRHMVDGANYGYFRKIDIPAGVNLSKLKCRKENGVLNVEAPFKPLPPACWR